MRRSAVAVIHMPQSLTDIELLFPSHMNWDSFKLYKPDFPFSNNAIEYLNALSKSLLKDKESRFYPDVITFAFFCRKANLLASKEKYVSSDIRLGRGLVYHIAPSNVPINFAYSMVAGLLGGNCNIVRVSTKYFPQVELVIKHMLLLSEQEDFKNVSKRLAVVRYDRISKATSYFSSICDVRIIWGGDNTIETIRENPIPARSFDVTFADRYSIAVINADELIKETNIERVATGFYNDTYLFDQNACSAPHLIIWTGENKNIFNAKEMFYKAVQNEVDKKYEYQTVLSVDKLTAFYRQSVFMSIVKEKSLNNSLIRVELSELVEDIDDFRCAGGYFTDYSAKSLNDILPIIKNNFQTLAYYGFEKDELTRFVIENRIMGIDRIVPIGSTTDFSLTWDGYNLIDTLSREVSII